MPKSRLTTVANVLLALLKAGCYLLLFLFGQTVVTVAVMAVFALWSYLNGGAVDPDTLLNDVLRQTPLITVCSAAVTLVILLVVFLIRKKNPLKEVGLVRTSPSVAAAAAAVTPALYMLVILVMGLLPEAWLEDYAQASAGLNDTGLLAFFGTVLAAPLVEEVIFRGLMQSRLARAMPGWLAAVVAALAFGLCHGQFVWVAYATLLGLIFGWIRLRSGSILPSLLAHFVFNLIGFFSAFAETGGFAEILLPALPVLSLIGCLLARRGLVQLFRPRPAQPEFPPDAT